MSKKTLCTGCENVGSKGASHILHNRFRCIIVHLKFSHILNNFICILCTNCIRWFTACSNCVQFTTVCTICVLFMFVCSTTWKTFQNLREALTSYNAEMLHQHHYTGHTAAVRETDLVPGAAKCTSRFTWRPAGHLAASV